MTYTAEHSSLKKRARVICERYRAAIYVLLSFSLGIILSAAADHGVCVNNGAALVGALGAGLQGAAALFGCVIGYSVFFGFDEAAVYIAASVVIYTISFVCQYSPIYKTRYFTVVNVSVVLGITSAFNAVSTLRGDYSYYFVLVIEIIRGLILTYSYQTTIKLFHQSLTGSDTRRRICILISISSFISSCFEIHFLGLSIGRILYFLALLMIVSLRDPIILCFSTVILSFAFLGIEQASTIFMYLNVLYAVGCMMFEVKSKKGSVFILTIFVLLFSTLHTTNLYCTLSELGTSVILFCLLPNSWLSSLRLYLNVKEIDQSVCHGHGTDDGSVNIAELLMTVSALLKSEDDNSNSFNDMIEVFECALDRVCNECTKKDICWENHHNELLGMFFMLKTKAEKRGKLILKDYPEWFVDYCPEIETIFMEINYELRNRAEKQLNETRIKRKNETTCDMLRTLSDIAIRNTKKMYYKTFECKRIESKVYTFLCNYSLECTIQAVMIREGVVRIELGGKGAGKLFQSFHYIEELSELLNMRLRVMKEESKKDLIVLYNAEPYAVSVGVATKKKTGERVCGDCYSYFKTEEGFFYVILSDGLGTGTHAEKQSKFMTCLLEKLIINNVSPLNAVQLASIIISLNNGESWNSATIDLLCLDLYSGSGCIYKVGAAPSYQNHKNKINKISENTIFDADLLDEPIQVFHEMFVLEPENVFILMSDGVMINDDEILRESIHKEKDSMKILARTILLNSQLNESMDDDMTVITVKMEHRV